MALAAQARGLVIDAATVVWWMQQSAESRIEIAAGGGKPLADVLGEFAAWLGEEPTEIWGNGASFDNVLLDEAFRAPVYYTRAYAACEKGSAENANRILRRRFYKSTDFS